MAKVKFSIRDNSREITRTELNIADITVANLGQQLTDMGTFRTALDGIILGVIAKEALVMDETNLSAAVPASSLAQRGIKWSVQYADVTQYFDPPTNAIPNAGYQQIFTNSIGTAEIALLVSGQEDLDLTAGVGLAFKNAFDGFIVSPYGGQTSLLRVYYAD